MNKNTLIVLFLIFAFVIAIFVVVNDEESKKSEVVGKEQLTPSIEQSPAEVSQSKEVVLPASTEEVKSETPEVVIDSEQSIDNEVVESAEVEDVVIPPIQSDLVGHWTFNDGSGLIAADTSGNNNIANLTNFDPTTAWVTGQIGGALKFDRFNDYVTMQHSDTLNLGMVDQSYAVSFWYMSEGRPEGERRIIGKGGRSGASPFIIRINKSGHPSFRISDGFQAVTILVKQSIANTWWHHVVAVRDAAQGVIRLYIDGKEVDLPVADTTNKTLENNLNITVDRYEETGGTFFYNSFSIDDVRIYNRALSSTEISNLFTVGKAGG